MSPSYFELYLKILIPDLVQRLEPYEYHDGGRYFILIYQESQW